MAYRYRLRERYVVEAGRGIGEELHQEGQNTSCIPHSEWFYNDQQRSVDPHSGAGRGYYSLRYVQCPTCLDGWVSLHGEGIFFYMAIWQEPLFHST